MPQPTGQRPLVSRLSGGPVQAALWLIVALLAVHAGILLLGPTGAVVAQPAPPGTATPRGETGGVFVVPAQLGKELYGAYLIDSRMGSIVVYSFNPNSNKLKLMAARTFVYDRSLEDYNTEPSPAAIADMVSRAKPIRPDDATPERPGGSGGGEKP